MVVAAPADDAAVGLHSAGMATSRADLLEGSGLRLSLPVVSADQDTAAVSLYEPTNGTTVGFHPASISMGDADLLESAFRRYGSRATNVTPTFHTIIVLDTAGVRSARFHHPEYPGGRCTLAITCLLAKILCSPAIQSTARTNATGTGTSHADLNEFPQSWLHGRIVVCLAPGSAWVYENGRSAPAGNLPIGFDAAGLIIASVDRPEGSRWGCGLSQIISGYLLAPELTGKSVIAAPADNAAIDLQTAGMLTTGTDALELSFRRRGLPVIIPTPADNGIVRPYPAGMATSRADLPEAF